MTEEGYAGLQVVQQEPIDENETASSLIILHCLLDFGKLYLDYCKEQPLDALDCYAEGSTEVVYTKPMRIKAKCYFGCYSITDYCFSQQYYSSNPLPLKPLLICNLP